MKSCESMEYLSCALFLAGFGEMCILLLASLRFFLHHVLLCPGFPHIEHLIMDPCLLIFFPFGASPSSLLVPFYFFLAPGMAMYPGATGLGFMRHRPIFFS